MPSQEEINRAARVIAVSAVEQVAPSRYKIGEVASPGVLKMAKHRAPAVRHSGATTHPIILRALSKHTSLYTGDIWHKVRESIPDFTRSGCTNRLIILRKAGFIESPSKGLWVITEAGKAQAESESAAIVPSAKKSNGAHPPTDLDREITRALEMLGDIKDVLVAARAAQNKASKTDERLARLIKALQS